MIGGHDHAAPGPGTRTMVLLWVVLLVIAACWDRAVYLLASAQSQAEKDAIESTFVYGVFYQVGRPWVWLAVTGVVLTADSMRLRGRSFRVWARRGVFIALCVGLATLAAELGKVVFRRERPNWSDGWYRFRGFFDEGFGVLQGTGLGLPSSHASASVAGALAIALCFPRLSTLGQLALILAAGCCVSRIASGAHFLTDVLAGAVVAGGVVGVLARVDQRNNNDVPIGEHLTAQGAAGRGAHDGVDRERGP